LQSHWELTDHAIQLVAVDYFTNFIYWMIPKQVQSLVKNKLSEGQHELWHGGIVMAIILPNDYFSADNDQQMLNNPFNLSNHLLQDSIKVCA